MRKRRMQRQSTRKCDRYGAEPDYCRGTGVLGNCSRLDVAEDKRELKIS